MNIFRILAQGDGSINEPNVSAFLGYLLNPNEDHGLGSRFIEPFLQQHYIQAKELLKDKFKLDWLFEKDRIVDLSTNSNYEINVFFEQAFAKEQSKKNEEKETKSVVDIILIIHEVEKEKREKYFENYLKNEKTLKHIFLIEVKITDKAVKLKDNKGKEGQLTKQVEDTKNEIKTLLTSSKIKFDFKNNISIIFVTPDSDKREDTRAYKAFKEFEDKEYKDLHRSHIFWNSIKNEEDVAKDDELENNNQSVEQMIDNIIKPKPEDKTEPLPQYTIDTLQSFSNFIYSGFSYKSKRPKGDNIADTFESKEYDEFKSKYILELNSESWNRIENIKSKILDIDRENLKIVHSKTHPISLFYTKYLKGKKGNKIFSFSNYSKSHLELHIINKNYKLPEFINKVKTNLSNYKSCIFNEEKWKDTLVVNNIEGISNEVIINLIKLQIQEIDKIYGK